MKLALDSGMVVFGVVVDVCWLAYNKCLDFVYQGMIGMIRRNQGEGAWRQIKETEVRRASKICVYEDGEICRQEEGQ